MHTRSSATVVLPTTSILCMIASSMHILLCILNEDPYWLGFEKKIVCILASMDTVCIICILARVCILE